MENDPNHTEETTPQLPAESSTELPVEPTTYQAGTSPEQLKQERAITIGIVVVALIFLAFIVLVTVFLLQQDVETTSKIADVFIIFMALQSLVIGLVLIILIVQLARLINLLQNEIKPIVESTNETVSTLRGTTQFISDNLSEPVIRLNEYLAGLGEFFRIIRPRRKKNPKQESS